MISIWLQTAVTLGDFANLTGIALLLIYGYFHFQYKQASNNKVQRETRRKSVAVMAVFLFYTVVVATIGVRNTWVAEVGTGVDRYFEEFARGLIFTQPPTNDTGPLGPILGSLKTVGLIAYVLTTAVLTVSASLPLKIYRSLF